MTCEEKVINKAMLGISPLTGKIYIYFPNHDGSAMYKKAVTETKEESIQLLKKWLDFLGGVDEEVSGEC